MIYYDVSDAFLRAYEEQDEQRKREIVKMIFEQYTKSKYSEELYQAFILCFEYVYNEMAEEER